VGRNLIHGDGGLEQTHQDDEVVLLLKAQNEELPSDPDDGETAKINAYIVQPMRKGRLQNELKEAGITA